MNASVINWKGWTYAHLLLKWHFLPYLNFYHNFFDTLFFMSFIKKATYTEQP